MVRPDHAGGTFGSDRAAGSAAGLRRARPPASGDRPRPPADIRRYETTLIRHTDRRLFTDRPVPAPALDRLRAAAEQEHVHLYLVRADDVPALAAMVSRAQAIQMADPGYRAELARWTQRPQQARDGVPADTATPPVARTVPVREFGTDATGGLDAGSGHDEAATFAVLAGDADDPAAWLRAGEALSAVLLTAVAEDLAVSPMSDVMEVGGSRAAVRNLLSGIGYPYLVLRIGTAEPVSGVPASPRRDPKDVIDIEP
jgi:hypothetical protein